MILIYVRLFFFKRLYKALEQNEFAKYFPNINIGLVRVETAGDADLHAYYHLHSFRYFD